MQPKRRRLLALTPYAKEEYQLENEQTGALLVDYDEGVRTFTVQTLGYFMPRRSTHDNAK